MCSGGDEGYVTFLSQLELATAKSMLQRGDEPYDVAFWFGLSEDELDDALNEYEGCQARTLPNEDLPPPGPYPSAQSAYAALEAIQKALDLLNAARALAGLPSKDFVLQKPERPARPTRPRTPKRPAESKPPIYRPVTPKARTPLRPAAASPPAEPTHRQRSLPVHVRLLFERGGFCRITLLPRRTPDLPKVLEIQGGAEELSLFMLQDEWFGDVFVSDAGRLMKEGAVWTATMDDGNLARWTLSGREIYVLAHRSDLNGFVSTARLAIGEEHIVLFTREYLESVREALDEAGCSGSLMLDTDTGLPDGWIGFQSVKPTRAVPFGPDGDVLNVLRPQAEIEIVLDGGIKIDRAAWLTGHPPRIEIHGDTGSAATPLIDGQEATQGSDGTFHASGWDSPGDHSVFCGSQNRSYSIIEGAQEWEPWRAHCWPLEEGDQAEKGPYICGALVYPPASASEGSRAFIAPSPDTLLLGAAPGQIAKTGRRKQHQDGFALAFPDFDPVWAVPANALRCNKHSSRVLLIAKTLSLPGQFHKGAVDFRRVSLWCDAILNAARKYLKCEPYDEDVTKLWRSYKKCARSIWKTIR